VPVDKVEKRRASVTNRDRSNWLAPTTSSRGNSNKEGKRKMSPVIWVDGTLLAPDEPAVTALDRGLLLGYGVFETLAVESGVPFALTRHLERLEKSARHIGLSLPREKIAAGLDAVMARWIETAGPWQRGRLRLTVT